jgi:hypothetical protein
MYLKIVSRNLQLPVLEGDGLYGLRKKPGPDRKDAPQGLKPDVFSIIYDTTKVVP